MSAEQFIEQRSQQLANLIAKEQQVTEALADVDRSAVPFTNEYGIQEWTVVTQDTLKGMQKVETAMKQDLAQPTI